MFHHRPENAFITAEDEGLELLQIPARKDNYFYLMHAAHSGETVAIDPGDADPILWAMRARNWPLTHIFNTHHHGDHVGGNRRLQEETQAEIFGYAGDASRIPAISRRLEEGEHFTWGGVEVEVIFVPGHTTGHIAYYLPRPGWLFCGDALFLMGCGRLFEGTPEQAYASLQKFAALPEDTLVFCAHEYTAHNGEFALSCDPQNAALQQRMAHVRVMRQSGKPTVPGRLAEEKATNPFLRASTPEEFAKLRNLRDSW
jgi:hydroxyacylglutathione hydrolase